MMKNIQEFLQHLYVVTYIPIYIHSGNVFTTCFPKSAGNYLPPEKYLADFLACERSVSFLMTDFYCFYGCVKEKATDTVLIAGPISSILYTDEIIRSMRREFLITENDAKTFTGYLHSIPLKNLNEFISYLSFLNFVINESKDTPKDVHNSKNTDSEEEISGHYITAQYNNKDYGFYNNSFEIEQKFITCIENGDLNGVTAFLTANYELKYGTIASNNLRQIKNIMIVSTAISSRAAIRGGLSSDTAFHLSDAYIQQIESLSSPDAIYTLCSKMLIDYTTRVADIKLPLNGDPIIQTAIRFVHQNTNRHITVSDVADHVGFSRAYLSHKFKETLGLDLSALIRRCKLEEAKELLRYTSKPISYISNYLCFSSQSHFQNLFKKQYGITPQNYRYGKGEVK